MKIALISGDWPPTACGIADYSRQLSTHLTSSGATVVEIDYGKSGFFIEKEDFDVAHIQLPSISGYGRSPLVPLLPFRLAKRTAATLHEYKISSFLRRKSWLPLAMMDLRVFSNEAEKLAYTAEWPLRRGLDTIIPIGSNIPRSSGRSERIDRSVCYFGLIMPKKGIEAFIELTDHIPKDLGFNFSIIGTNPSSHIEYFSYIKALAENKNIHLHLDRSSEEVSELLSTQEFAFLPFPDGASEKRGSLLACWANGTIVLAPVTQHTPAWMTEALVSAPTPVGAAEALISSVQGRRDFEPVRTRARIEVERFGWSSIATTHLSLYEKLLLQPYKKFRTADAD